jgi:uncharacterized protein YjiS (DUF1127 family)
MDHGHAAAVGTKPLADFIRWRRAVAAAVAGIGATVTEWRRRARSRGELAMMSDHDLRELNFHGDVRAEMRKTFWEA